MTIAMNAEAFLHRAKGLCDTLDIPVPKVLGPLVCEWRRQGIDLGFAWRRTEFALRRGTSLSEVDDMLRLRLTRHKLAVVSPQARPCEEPKEELVGTTEPDPAIGKLATAEGWLRTKLANGPARIVTLRREAAKIGIQPRTFERARKALGIVTKRIGFGPHGYVEVELPW